MTEIRRYTREETEERARGLAERISATGIDISLAKAAILQFLVDQTLSENAENDAKTGVMTSGSDRIGYGALRELVCTCYIQGYQHAMDHIFKAKEEREKRK